MSLTVQVRSYTSCNHCSFGSWWVPFYRGQDWVFQSLAEITWPVTGWVRNLSCGCLSATHAILPFCAVFLWAVFFLSPGWPWWFGVRGWSVTSCDHQPSPTLDRSEDFHLSVSLSDAIWSTASADKRGTICLAHLEFFQQWESSSDFLREGRLQPAWRMHWVGTQKAHVHEWAWARIGDLRQSRKVYVRKILRGLAGTREGVNSLADILRNEFLGSYN